jgi:HPt (histidine-containing phosphotransfer) domain-containing protein
LDVEGKGERVSEQRSAEAVDFAWLEAYAAHDEALVREVLTVFCAEAAEWAPRLRAGDDAWRAVVHTMKGTSRAIGAGPLGDLCERAETEGAQVLPEVRAMLVRVTGEVADYLARRRGG